VYDPNIMKLKYADLLQYQCLKEFKPYEHNDFKLNVTVRLESILIVSDLKGSVNVTRMINDNCQYFQKIRRRVFCCIFERFAVFTRLPFHYAV